MPSRVPWLLLKTQLKDMTRRNARGASLFFVIPKKTVRLATQRNRIKRLIREAVRGEERFNDASRSYWFRVVEKPEVLDFHEVKEAIRRLASDETG